MLHRDRSTRDRADADRRRGIRRAGARIAVLAAAGAALATVGGIGFAANTLLSSAQVAVQKVAPGSAREIAVRNGVAVRNAASDQYVDTGTVVTKAGPPEVFVTNQRKDADGDPVPLRAAARPGDPDLVLNASLSVSESGTLSIQVLRESGSPAKIDCARTTVQTGNAGTADEATLCRVVINSPGTLKVVVYVPAKNVSPGEDINIRLGYTDRDASRKRTVVDVPAEAPGALPRLTRTFRLTDEDIADVQAALVDGGAFKVGFRAYVRGTEPTVSISWANRTFSGLSTGPVTYERLSEVDRTAFVTVTGGEIAGGDFSVTDYACTGTATNINRPGSLLATSSVTLTLRKCGAVKRINIVNDDNQAIASWVAPTSGGTAAADGSRIYVAQYIWRVPAQSVRAAIIDSDNRIVGYVRFAIPQPGARRP